ncbi:MAG: SDR family oxidoreductase [Microvirga sp.]
MDIKGKTVLVTGASSGLGQHMARRFAEAGARIAILGRDAEKLKVTEDACRAAGAEVSAAAGEIADADFVAQAFARAEGQLGPVDILVNCAGISLTTRRKVEDIDPETWDRFIDTNLRGTFLTCRQALPGMKERGSGAIVNIGSTGAHIARANVSVYAASKFAVRALTDSLIEETDGSGVRICLVSAGPIDTPFWQTYTGEPPMRPEEMLQPDDLADAAIWLIERPGNVRVDEILLRPYAPTARTAREARP